MNRKKLLTILSKLLWPGFLLVYAESTLNQGPELCNYAGYLSVLREDGKCQNPWKLEASELGADLDELYTSYNTCEGSNSNAIRCNPILYGFQSEHQSNSLCLRGRKDRDLEQGCCIKSPNQWDASVSTRQCNQILFGNYAGLTFRNFVDSMVKKPERLARYLAMASSFIQSCNPAQQECSTLKSLVTTSLKRLDLKQNPLLSYSLSKKFLDLRINVRALRRNFDALEDEGLNNAVDQTISWQKRRLTIIRQLVEEYENNTKTEEVIKHAIKQARARRARGDKLGQCYTYVKRALLGGGYLDSYFWTGRGWAKEAIHDLPPLGFIDITSFGIPLDPRRAPHGSIVVYEGGPYGHIEIVNVVTDSKGKPTRRFYISDLINNKPVSEVLHPWRRPIAIMIAINDEDRKDLEIPPLQSL